MFKAFFQDIPPGRAISRSFRQVIRTGSKLRVESKGMRCIEELIELCQREGIKILLVYSPEYHEIQVSSGTAPRFSARSVNLLQLRSSTLGLQRFAIFPRIVTTSTTRSI